MRNPIKTAIVRVREGTGLYHAKDGQPESNGGRSREEGAVPTKKRDKRTVPLSRHGGRSREEGAVPTKKRDKRTVPLSHPSGTKEPSPCPIRVGQKNRPRVPLEGPGGIRYPPGGC